MMTRAKWLAVILALGAISVLSESGKETKAGVTAVVMFAMMAGVVWLAWRGFVFLRLLFAPVREKLKPYADPLNDHLEDTLRRSGLGKVADVSKSMASGLDGAVKATQDKIDARR